MFLSILHNKSRVKALPHDVEWKCHGVFVHERSANLCASLASVLKQQFIQTQACQLVH